MTTATIPAFVETRNGRRYFADPPAGASAPFVNGSRAIVARMQRLARDLADTRTNHRLTDQELVERTAQLTRAAVAELETEARKIMAAASEAESLSLKYSYIKPHSPSTTFVEAMIDLELGRQFAAMAPAARATLTHQMRNEPWVTLRWSEALARLPVEVSGLSVAEKNAIRDSATRCFAPDAWALIERETAAATAAMQTVTTAAAVLRELTPSASAALVTAPTLARAAGWTEVAERAEA